MAAFDSVRNMRNDGKIESIAHLAEVIHEKLASAEARGGPDNSGITERGIRGIFYDTLELAARDMWSVRLGLPVASDTKTEKHRWLGSVPEPRRHFGGLNLQPLRNYSLDITNEDFEVSLPISLHDWERDKISHLSRKVAELSVSWADHWNVLSTEVLENNDTAYDGVALFAGTHSIGDSGTMDNDLAAGDVPALNVADASRATKAEASAILTGLSAYMFGYKDDYGRPANVMAKNFLLVCTPTQYPGFRQAIADELYVQGGSNELARLGLNFDVVAEPRLTGGDSVVYLARTDGISQKPFIHQREKEPDLQFCGPDSEHAIKNNEVVYVSKARRAAAPGEFRHIVKATLS